ncbi:MAG: hypothetical protein IT460_03700 [Planctomycetes bacterium]|nr:hypothetical protein [Planctomycetota bacterium]
MRTAPRRWVGIVGAATLGAVVAAWCVAGREGAAAPADAPPALPAAPAAPVPAPGAFPAAWAGHWKGPARIVGGASETAFAMELVVAPTDDPARWTWTIVYDGAAGRQTRPYTLVVTDAAAGRYEVDEGGGVRIAHRLLDGALWSHFEVGGTRLTTRERVEGAGTPDERLTVEIVTARASAEPGARGVTSFPVGTLQTATLRRVR